MNQLSLFKGEKAINKEEIESIKEKIKKEKYCECGRLKTWDVVYRDYCEECLKKKYLEEFKKAGLDEKGFKYIKTPKGYVFEFFSHTTGIERTNENRILAVTDFSVENPLFPYTIWTCDEFGLHENTFGITKEFAEFLIKELNLKKKVDKADSEYAVTITITRWINPKIRQDEKGKRIAEIRKEIETKKQEIIKLMKELKDLKK